MQILPGAFVRLPGFPLKEIKKSGPPSKKSPILGTPFGDLLNNQTKALPPQRNPPLGTPFGDLLNNQNKALPPQRNPPLALPTCTTLKENVHPCPLTAGSRQARCVRAEYGLPAPQLVVFGEIHRENVHSLKRNAHSLRKSGPPPKKSPIRHSLWGPA